MSSESHENDVFNDVLSIRKYNILNFSHMSRIYFC